MGSSPTLGEKYLWYSKNNLLRIHLTECLNAIEKNLINSSILYSTEKTIQPKTSEKGWSLPKTVSWLSSNSPASSVVRAWNSSSQGRGFEPSDGRKFFIMFKKQYFSNPNDGQLQGKLKKSFQFFYILYNRKNNSTKNFGKRMIISKHSLLVIIIQPG